MSDGYLKSPCEHCELNIEFPVDSVGEIVRCPHCNLPTPLNVPVPDNEATLVGGSYAKWLVATVIFCAVLTVVAIGGLFYAKSLKKKKGAPTPAAPPQTAGTPASAPGAAASSGAVPEGKWKNVQPQIHKFQAGYSAAQIRDGRNVLGGACVDCHEIYNPADYRDEEWKSTINNMRGRAKLRGREYEDLVRFVATIR